MATTLFIGEGNLGSVPVLKQVSSTQSQTGQVSVLEFSARVNVDRKNKQSGQFEDTLGFWVDVSYWGKAAEVMAPLLQKGARVLLVGELGIEPWVSNQPATQGQQRQSQKLRAEHVAILPWGVEQVVYRARTQAAPQSVPQQHVASQPMLAAAQQQMNSQPIQAGEQPAQVPVQPTQAPAGAAAPAVPAAAQQPMAPQSAPIPAGVASPISQTITQEPDDIQDYIDQSAGS